MSNTQRYKQMGNSVTIPVIEEMALFMKTCLTLMGENLDG
jgi:DNA (cytosine-5)-methyltransferase 1